MNYNNSRTYNDKYKNFKSQSRIYGVWDYKSYSEIPKGIEDYLLTVSCAEDIKDVPLNDINDYLNGLNEYLK